MPVTRIFGRGSSDTRRSHAVCARSIVPLMPVSTPTTSRLGLSITQYGPGCAACSAGCCDGLLLSSRASASTRSSIVSGRRHSSPRSPRSGRGLSGGASQNTRMNPPSPSYQSWLPGIA
jgi:hypothetical protein